MTDPTSPPPDPWPPVPDDPAWAVRERQKHVARSLGRHAAPRPVPGLEVTVHALDVEREAVRRAFEQADARVRFAPQLAAPATSPRIWPAVVAALLVGAVAGALLTSAWWLW